MQQQPNPSFQEKWPDFNVTKYPLVEVRRKFNAPVEKVWNAWTNPELVKQWWGPEQYTCPVATMDVRAGGKFNAGMRGPDGKTQFSGGVYHEVVPFKKIVSSDMFTDESGNKMSPREAGMPGEWPDVLKLTIEFESLGPNECEIHLVHEGIPKDQHDDCVSGWTSSINKLQRLVEHM
jgi:uncharacterized protein YndB with AHSA1/START domain